MPRGKRKETHIRWFPEPIRDYNELSAFFLYNREALLGQRVNYPALKLRAHLPATLAELCRQLRLECD